MPNPSEFIDPQLSHNFLVEIQGISRGSFHEVTGLDSTVDVIEHREGGWNQSPRKLPAQTKHANIVLKWGLNIDRDLIDWHQQIVAGDIQRKDGSIVLLDRRGGEVARWNFERAWPTKYTGPTFSAEASEVAMETLELAHEGVRRVS
ncbi:phage tail protein [Microbacterium terricola]|uniref:Phage tail protein n=1 Tax=Microbacterium terricola TaxID=344163 RepID=A0ABM8E185_9MICO|nr:phage tail protein [Microbacterium terricola]UYK40711.1 phage tail protein [Microbacterium terricola]BDV31552.1 phage tail protein [Microbacterium terricola]